MAELGLRRALYWWHKTETDQIKERHVAEIFHHDFGPCVLGHCFFDVSLVCGNEEASLAALTFTMPFKIFIQNKGDLTTYDYFDIPNENCVYIGQCTTDAQRCSVNINRKLLIGDRLFIMNASVLPTKWVMFCTFDFNVGT